MTSHQLLCLLLTLAVSSVAGLLFRKWKVPGGLLVGAIVGSAIVNLGFGLGYSPRLLKTIAQITAGAFIGSLISRDDIPKLKKIYKVGTVIILSYVAVNLGIGFLLRAITPYDLLTCLMCTIPGGLADVPLIAAEMGADLAPVVVVHFVRAAIGIGVFPSIIISLTKDDEPQAAEEEEAAKAAPDKNLTRRVVVTLALAALFGMIGKQVGIPVGALVFSLIGIAAVKLAGYPAVVPVRIKRIAQVLSGAYIGCAISISSIAVLRHSVVAVVIVLAAFLLNAWITGNFVHRAFGVPLREAMLMLTPAGAGDMALISQDLGVSSPTLVLVHVIRLFVSDAILPQICLLLSHLTGL